LIAAVRLSSSALSMVGADRARIGSRAILFLLLGALGATVFIFAVPRTPFDALDFARFCCPT